MEVRHLSRKGTRLKNADIPRRESPEATCQTLWLQCLETSACLSISAYQWDISMRIEHQYRLKCRVALSYGVRLRRPSPSQCPMPPDARARQQRPSSTYKFCCAQSSFSVCSSLMLRSSAVHFLWKMAHGYVGQQSGRVRWGYPSVASRMRTALRW